LFHLARYYQERHGKQMLRAAWLTPAGAEALAEARQRTGEPTDAVVDHALQLYAIATKAAPEGAGPPEVVTLQWPYGRWPGAECTVAFQ